MPHDTLLDPRRLAALDESDLLDTLPEESFDRLARLAGRLLQAPLAQVNLVDDRRQFSKSSIAPAEWTGGRDAPLRDSFCQYTIRTHQPVVIEDARVHPLVAESAAVTGHGLIAYAGMPLVSPDGFALGTLCVGDFTPRRWTEGELQVLSDLADAVATEIELRREYRRRAHALHEAAESRRMLASLLGHMPGAAYRCRNEAGWPAELVSRGVYDLTGHLPEAFTTGGVAFADLIHPDDRQAVWNTVQEAVASARPFRTEYRIRRRDGVERWVWEQGEGVFSPEGELVALEGFVLDVTERIGAFEALRTAKDEAERANRAKSEFLSRMSHELRTPMNAILGFGQLLELEAETEESRESVHQILHAGGHLLRLIDEVLDLASIEAERLAVSLGPVPLLDVLRQCLDMVRSMGTERRVSFHLEAGCDAYVQADQQRLRQVLLNLMSNAVKYNREGGSVSISCRPAAGDRLRVMVTDTGKGLAPEMAERLFRAFERLDAARSGVQGTGLGLALSKGLVEAMGGDIGAESTPGQGSTFWVELPRADASAAEAVPAGGGGRRAGPRTILYVEDNASNVRLMERILAPRADLELATATTGREGLSLARSIEPELILLDVHLPDMQGEQVLASLRADPVLREIPAVVVSADATPEQVQRVLAAGARDYLTKPFDVRRLLAAIEDALDHRSHTAASDVPRRRPPPAPVPTEPMPGPA